MAKEKKLGPLEYPESEEQGDQSQLEFVEYFLCEDGFYTGQILKGTKTRSGRGRLMRPNGAIWEGQWHDNMINGYGRTIAYNVFVGFMTNNENVQGKLIRNNGSTYEGKFGIMGMPHDEKAIVTDPTGEKFYAEYVYGEKIKEWAMSEDN